MEYADGLFFQTGLAIPTIRIEAPSLAMVFTDGPALGSDLDGFLFYNSVASLGDASYILSEEQDPQDLSYYAKVQFFYTSSISPNPYAVFLARDNHRIIDTLLGNSSQNGSGLWTKLDIGCSTAVMEKKSYSTAVTITARSIRRQATFQANNHFSAAEFSIQGNLAFGTLAKVSEGTTAASCLDDRIYFSPQNSVDFRAFFMHVVYIVGIAKRSIKTIFHHLNSAPSLRAMADLFDGLKQQYTEMKFAEALLFRSRDGTRRSLRVEADTIGLEFTDNVYLGVVEIPPRPPFGRDPEGFLFYNDLQNFTSGGNTTYQVTQEKNPADNTDCLRVKFYHGAVVYAQVLRHSSSIESMLISDRN
ncbi:hypothetical protein CVT26_003583 [Gymnopilus dilepis]|uniref:Uncharacterized protein n=1 Tax=Gymnopilus dilepis TaxID=231916 RepID=A0A409VS78_9AGAR|nr:hypothetical protein CVT26_003583 [Gymnopilus dilepis]